MKKSLSFTLLELLISMAIVAVLGSVTFVVLNPVENLKRGRDIQRISEINTINKALSLFTVEYFNATMGSSTTVYISLPDASATCGAWPLPTLPSGWTYACAPSATYQKTDGTGWIPVSMNQLSFGSPISKLPIDPTNNATYYYMFNTGGSFEVSALMESSKYTLGGDNDVVSNDGGDDFTRYEQGSDLTLAPWSFEFSAFPVQAESSKKPGWYRSSGNATSTISIMSDTTSSNFLRASGWVWYIWQQNIPYNPNAIYEMDCRIRQVIDPVNGGKYFYCGWAGVASNGVTKMNYNGADSYSSQHYHAVAGGTLSAGGGWTTYTGYTSGLGNPNGGQSTCPNVSSPCKMYQDVRFIRPLFILNYSAGDGTADIDYIRVTKR